MYYTMTAIMHKCNNIIGDNINNTNHHRRRYHHYRHAQRISFHCRRKTPSFSSPMGIQFRVTVICLYLITRPVTSYSLRSLCIQAYAISYLPRLSHHLHICLYIQPMTFFLFFFFKKAPSVIRSIFLHSQLCFNHLICTMITLIYHLRWMCFLILLMD